MTLDKYYTRVKSLADSIITQKPAKMRWMWGEALLGYALSELDAYEKRDDYTAFLTGFCDYYVDNEPRVDQADTSAPGLISYAMQKKTGNEDYKKLTDKVIDYIKHEPRLIDDAVNHLGNSPEGKFYPQSIWVDSLMMFSVFAARYARENDDEPLLEMASRQPRLYASYMQDSEQKLWYHSYWVKSKTHYPRKPLFWGRGNGWVLAALPMIAESLGEDHAEYERIKEIFTVTAAAIVKHHRDDNFYDTLLGYKKKTYRESSATALIALGYFQGYRLGWLDDSYLEKARASFRTLADALLIRKGRVSMDEISGPTIPLQLLPFLGYRLIPKAKNFSFGVAALILAAIEYDRTLQEGL